MHTRAHSSRRRPRHGHVIVEVILIFPILCGMLLGMIEFSLLLNARQQLQAAVRQGAGIASRGGDRAEVEKAIKDSLGYKPDGIDVEAIASQPPLTRDSVRVRVRVRATRLVPNLLPFIINLKDQTLSATALMASEWSEPGAAKPQPSGGDHRPD